MPSKSAPPSRKLTKTKHPGIYERGGRFVVVFRDPHGHQRKRSAKTLAEAKRVKASLTTDVARGEFRELSRLTFAQYVPQWVEMYNGRTDRGIRAATRADYKQMLNAYALPHFGRMRLTAITPPDLKAFVKTLTDAGLKPNTVRNVFAPVRALLATCVEDGLIRSNPAQSIRLATARASADAPVKALTEKELRELLKAIPDEWRLFIRFLAHTGVRIGECVALTWSDIDLGQKRVRISRRIYRTEVGEPKSRYGIRDIPLTDALARDLFQTGRSERKDEPIFPSSRGTPLNDSNVRSRIFNPAAEKAGVPWAGFHTLRHTCATMLFRNGANAKQVQVWLGHHSPAFTLETYVHLLPDDLPDPEILSGLFTVKPTDEGSPSEDATAVSS